jgi:DNA-3-methyladenine glycosylase II
LASARAALNKLREKIGIITPKKLLTLSDKELRACYFSRQKTVYARCLANTIVSNQVILKTFPDLDDAKIRRQLKTIKGIGDWTVDVYLLFALQRTDIFPLGDLAMVNALKEVKQLSKETKQEELLKLGERWRPYRSIATMLLWHYYIQKRGIKL